MLFTLMHCQFLLWVRVVVFKFQIYFSFIGGGNQSTRRKPPTLLVFGTDCIGSCKSNYHTIATPVSFMIEINKKYNCPTIQLILFDLANGNNCFRYFSSRKGWCMYNQTCLNGHIKLGITSPKCPYDTLLTDFACYFTSNKRFPQ